MILINRIRAKFITIKRDPPAVLMGCWRVLLFLVWCKFLFFEFPCCFCTLERLGYFFTQYLVTFSLSTWLLFSFDLVTWLPFCPALGYFYIFFICNMRCLFALRFAPNCVVQDSFASYSGSPPWQTHSLPPKWFILPICRNTDFMNRYDLGTSLK